MTDAKSVAEAVFRQQSGRIIATLIRISGSFDLAEEALQEAFTSAIARWPESGVPDNPAAWITTAAHRRLIDALRRSRTRREKEDPLRYETPTSYDPEDLDAEAAFDASSMNYPDDRLRLIFTCCHPAINTEAQVALTLRTLGGLTTPEIARAFLVPEATLAQRLVRAKSKIAQAHIPVRSPAAAHAARTIAAGASRALSDFQRGLFRDRRRHADSQGTLRGSHPPRAFALLVAST